MKKIGPIALAVIVVAVAVPVVLTATLPTAKVTITAIRPTGQIVARTNINGDIVSGPEWVFGITNVGRAPARWITIVYSRRIGVHDQFYTVKPLRGLNGVLQPREGVVKNMIVLTGKEREWTGEVQYQTVSTPLQAQLWKLRVQAPGIRHLFSKRASNGVSQTSWHPTTDGPMIPPTVWAKP